MGFVSRAAIFLIGTGTFFLFIFFSYLVHEDLFTRFDFDTTVRLQDNLSRRLDNGFSLLSEIGSFEVLTVLLLILLVAWRKIRAAFFLVAYVGFHLIELYGKFFVSHPPPPEFMLRTERLLHFPQFHVRAENSYPSGHSGRTTFLAILLIMMIWGSKKFSAPVKLFLIAIIIIFDLSMLVSRVYLGEHWVSDVIGGAMLGAGLALATYAVAK